MRLKPVPLSPIIVLPTVAHQAPHPSHQSAPPLPIPPLHTLQLPFLPRPPPAPLLPLPTAPLMHSNTATNHQPHPTHQQRCLQPHLAVAKPLPRGNVVHTRLVRGHDDGIEGEDDGVEDAEDQGLYEGVNGVEVGFSHEVPG